MAFVHRFNYNHICRHYGTTKFYYKPTIKWLSALLVKFYLRKLENCSRKIRTGLLFVWQQVVSYSFQWSLHWEQRVCNHHKYLLQQPLQSTSSFCSSSFLNLEMVCFLQRMFDLDSTAWQHCFLKCLCLLSWLQFGWLTAAARKLWENPFLLLSLNPSLWA